MGDVRLFLSAQGLKNHIEPLNFPSTVNTSLEFDLLTLCPTDGKI